jgi:hypothetical protein
MDFCAGNKVATYCIKDKKYHSIYQFQFMSRLFEDILATGRVHQLLTDFKKEFILHV